jgi:hypothetical protein
MARTIYKYPVVMSADYDVILPEAHRVIHVDWQGGMGAGLEPQMWVEVDTDSAMRPFAFAIVGTGHPVPDGMEHVGTWQEPPFVWHLYEHSLGRLDIPL